MPTLTDENGVVWEIRTTQVQVDNGPAKGSFFATPTVDEGINDYSGAGHRVADDEDIGIGPDVRTTWPVGGNPIIRGPGAEGEAKAAIARFAFNDSLKAKNGQLRALVIKGGGVKVTATRDSGGLVALVIIIGLLLMDDKKKRR